MENANYVSGGLVVAFATMKISISKEVLHSIYELGFEETILGDAKESLKQYRNSTGLHAREYGNRFVIHRDRVDPRTDPIGHLVKDSPGTLLSFGASLLMSRSGRYDHGSRHSTFNLISFVLSVLSLNRIISTLKRLA